ncbi:MAG: penicillin-insensitive murein endopeptidase [Deltaproteobacteria bacterium]|nr:penicillin-insensitive murein endopeptidase [Deltaproteobacteria bacterium]
MLVAAGTLLSGCTPWMAITSEAGGPVGSTSNGVLVGGRALPAEGADGYAFYHQRDRRYGSLALTALVEDVARDVSSAYPGSVLQVRDLSGDGGGRISGHHSHRTGMDVDLAFFVRNPKKKSTREFVLAKHDALGVAVGDHAVAYFDTPKNWAVVEALLSSNHADIQWIFISKGLKARLLAYALAAGKDVELIEKASMILHQPKDSAIHNDHFHVRIFCPPVDVAPACEQRKPIWPWIKEKQTPPPASVLPSDHQLMALALEGL